MSFILKYCLYIPNCRNNLISLFNLNKFDFLVSFNKDVMIRKNVYCEYWHIMRKNSASSTLEPEYNWDHVQQKVHYNLKKDPIIRVVLLLIMRMNIRTFLIWLDFNIQEILDVDVFMILLCWLIKLQGPPQTKRI